MSTPDSSDEATCKPEASSGAEAEAVPSTPVQSTTGDEPRSDTAPVDRLDLIDRLHKRITSDWGSVGMNLALLGGVALLVVLVVVAVAVALPALTSIISAHGAPTWLIQGLLGAAATTAIGTPVVRRLLRRRGPKDPDQ